eukprot:CAMPEP_0113317110 /NCGR_PEP_ID=MMETSP0010_2-20120614/12132_1 /TAXON_ID=216773 ORGANISM="Corethron hystrix, Strain 308" /NCGR_SAMPLE_ID=MMETSP0010_2 /ASSEMBLY_ACC=CAM_ASM_000155 /LENGTH=235 /DNA_ID=CAMNT_0000173991 /DNA_START=322 /DNA_END=1029 /DNA_ORIENTATION=+ /assembly_acc=CAM_ASM_000155
MIQQGQPLSADPRKLYRGVGANCINMGSCTMIQFAAGGSLKKSVLGSDQTRNLTPSEEVACGLGGGILSASVGSPLELIMIQQQRKGKNTINTLKDVAVPSVITRGLLGTAVREGLWTVGYLSIPPIIRRELMTRYPERFDSVNKARVPAALLGGLFGCYLTHPFDTVKTCMQGDIERTTYGTFTDTAKKIYTESSIAGFYRGATFRYGRMVCAVFMMDVLQANIGPLLYPKAFE